MHFLQLCQIGVQPQIRGSDVRLVLVPVIAGVGQDVGHDGFQLSTHRGTGISHVRKRHDVRPVLIFLLRREGVDTNEADDPDRGEDRRDRQRNAHDLGADAAIGESSLGMLQECD
jgi:hypothetical protein